MTSQNKKKVFVGVSGGVDSSVSAALLKQAGFDVTGVFIKVWQPDWIECNWKEERRDAMRVCAHLDIPFITLDLVNEYKKDVIDYMIREYSLGRTPNPDVMCNRYVKFGGFLDWAKKQGAQYVATGHYAQVVAQNCKLHALSSSEFHDQSRSKVSRGEEGENGNGSRQPYHLLAGIDANKDQSYFLWTLNQKDLPYILFPVGHLTKPEVRNLAEKFGLPTATKKDSQGLCFIGKVDIKKFLSHYIETKSGNVLNERGEIIGTHPGALFFTNGERRGFVIDHKNKTPNDLPYFVIDKDMDQNTITVSNKGGGVISGGEKRVIISNINWVSGQIPDFYIDQNSTRSDENSNYGESVISQGTLRSVEKFPLKARFRYRQPLQKIRIVSANISELTLEFEQAQDVLSPGQSLVIYDGEECLGGGVIC